MEYLEKKHTKGHINMHTKAMVELLIVIGVMIVSALFFPQIKGVVIISSIIYFLVDRKIRNRTNKVNDLTFRRLPQALKNNWILILLVGVILQGCYVLMYKTFFPNVLEHVIARVPIDITSFNSQIIFSVVILAFGEEIVFRGFLQAELNKFMPPVAAILITSALFTMMHLSTGVASVVAIDLTTVFLDSIVFGIIFARTRNIVASTIAHVTANLFAMILLLLM